MRLIVCFLLSAFGLGALAAPPAVDKPARKPIISIFDDPADSFWNFDNIFRNFWPSWNLDSLDSLGPKIVNDPTKFQVNMEVKDFKLADLKVKIENCFLTIRGSHDSSDDIHHVMSSQFFQTYSIPENVTVDAISAVLSSDGWLSVTVPLGGGSNCKQERSIDVTESGKPYSGASVGEAGEDGEDASVERVTGAAPAASSSEAPRDREEVTEKDEISNDVWSQ